MKKTILFLMIILTFASVAQQKKQTSMSHILKNKNLELNIDLPLANYDFSRFDWTGKITWVKYKGTTVSGVESVDGEDENKRGKGLYNEFGIENPLGYNEIKNGEWFHKIGVGLLKKEGDAYDFSKAYEIKPADFKWITEPNKIIFEVKSKSMNGYSYVLRKEIELLESSFIIRYRLKNTGEKAIVTNEYCHNFLAINNELVGNNYRLKFPFIIKPELFGAAVNPEESAEIGPHEITFNNTPNEQFFFSNLSGSHEVEASWELINTKAKLGVSEQGNFKTNKINLWGWKHVISPELFFEINLTPGQMTEWSRTFRFFVIHE